MRQLALVLCVLVGFMAVEIVGGLVTGSLALLADAGHLLTDVVGIGLALLAIWFAHRPAPADKSYGYYRVEIFAAGVNAMILLAVSGFIIYEAIRRLGASPDVIGIPMLAIAALGLLVTGFSVRVLHAGAQHSLNLRATYLEMLGDVLGLSAVLVAGIVISATGWTPIDPIASIVIGVLIIPRAWTLVRDAVDILLQATPRNIDMEEVRSHVLGAPGVADIHDLHAWTLTSGINVVSVHVVLRPQADPNQVLDELCTCLAEDFDMEHSTIQVEPLDRRPVEPAAHH